MLYVLLIGVVLCLIFAGVIKCLESTGEKEDLVNQSTAIPYAEAGSIPVEVPTEEWKKR